MQNKGLLTTFTILFAMGCLYALSLTWVANGIERDAKEYANGNSDLEFAYLDSMASEKVYPVIDYTYGELRGKMLNLGLDLKGGMNVTLEIQVAEVVRALASNNRDVAFNTALSEAKKMQHNSNEEFVTLFGQAYQDANPTGQLSAIFYTLDNKDKLSPNATNEEVLEFVKEEADGAIDRSFNVIKTRVGLFGSAQPSIQRLTGSDRILVELPGVKDKERVRQLLQGTAKLEFWLTWENREVYPMIEQADTKLGEVLQGEDKEENTEDALATAEENTMVAEADTATESAASDLFADLENGADSSATDSIASALNAAEDAAQYAKDHPLFSVMRPAIFQNPETQQYEYGKGPVVGYVAVKDTAIVNKYLGMKEVQSFFPPRLKFLWAAKPYDEAGKYLQLIAIKIDNRDGDAALEGDVIVDASSGLSLTGGVEIDMQMNTEGARKWKKLTGNNIGKAVAIVLDNAVYSYPNVNGEIPNGRSQISGDFTIEEGTDLANILKAGKLPAVTRIIQADERVENVLFPIRDGLNIARVK